MSTKTTATLRVVPKAVDPELHRVALDIVHRVESGECVGLGVVVVLRGNSFFVDAFGTMTRTPHEARGMAAALDDHLRDLASEYDGA